MSGTAKLAVCHCRITCFPARTGLRDDQIAVPVSDASSSVEIAPVTRIPAAS